MRGAELGDRAIRARLDAVAAAAAIRLRCDRAGENARARRPTAPRAARARGRWSCRRATERAPLELLAIMPPTVARLADDTSGAKRRWCGRSAAFSSSSTTPGSTRAQRSSGLISRMRLRCFEVSSTSPAPIDWPACDVPPPRGVIGTPCRAAMLDRAHHRFGRSRDDDAERLDLVDAGVGRVQRARDLVEADFAVDGRLRARAAV